MGDSTTNTNYHSSATYKTAGNRHIRLTATQLYCQNYSTFKDTTVNIQFPVAGVRMPSVSAYKGVPKPLQGRTIPGYRYLWTPTRGIDLPDSSSVSFNHQFTQEYIYNLISPGGCVTYDTALVRVFDDKLVDIFVPKSFTPNGDGVNDILYPYLTGIQTFKYFKIYNRFGKLMFETTNPDVGWNGSFNGVQQPMSIYIWVTVGVATDGSPLERKGETLLLR
jgi:gliding motility-associated-like protein